MTDSANVIRLEPDVQRHVRARLARLSAPVRMLHETGQQSLTTLLHHFFDAADDALFDLADKAKTNAEQNSYFDAMREVRVQRKGIERRLFDAIDEAFARFVGADDRDQQLGSGELSADALSLVGNDDLEQMVALEATVNRAFAKQRTQTEPLLRMLSKLAGIKIGQEQYPFSVFCLCHGAMAQFKRLDVDIKSKLMLFHLFERIVINRLDEVNQAIFASLESQGIAVDRTIESTVPETEKPLSAVGPVVDTNQRELLQLLSFVQKLPLATATGSQGLDVERVLSTVQHRRGIELKLGRLEKETMHLVQMLFRFILQAEGMAKPMQELICRLQVPVLKVALLDPDFLTNKKHPARRLLNQLAGVAVQWQEGEAEGLSPSLYRLVQASVDRILARFDVNVSLFSEVLADFTSVMEKEKRAAIVQEKRTVDAEDGKAKAAQARQLVAAEIAAQTEGQQLPPLVLALINGPWNNVLFVAGLKHGFGSSQWRAQLEVLGDLIKSVQPCTDQKQRKQLIALIPNLVQRMRMGLDAISYNPFEVEELFAGLEQIHLQRIRGEVDTADSITPAVTDDAPHEAPEPAQEAVAEKHQEAPPAVKAEADAVLPADDPHVIAVSTFSHGAWFDLTLVSREACRCRLAAYIKPTDKYIFVDRSGAKVAEQTRNELALALKQGRLTPVDNNMLFDRALESVVTSLRKAHSGMPLDKESD